VIPRRIGIGVGVGIGIGIEPLLLLIPIPIPTPERRLDGVSPHPTPHASSIDIRSRPRHDDTMSRRFWWALALLSVVPVVGLVVWLNQPGVLRFPVQQTVLTNGTTLQLVSVQHGRFHYDPFTPPWQQWASRLPESWTRRLKLKLPPNLNVAGSNAVLSVWLTASKAPANINQPAYGIRVGDDDGNFAGDDGGLPFAAGKTPLIAHYEAHRVAIFPRRARELRIRIYDDPWSQDEFLHEFRIPNPDPTSTEALPPLVAQPLPQSQASGDLEATLVHFDVQPSSEGSANPDPISRKARLEFTMRQAGQPTTNWVSYHVRKVSDATGNEGDGNNWDHGWDKDRAFVAFSRWPLPVGEPWRMEVEFCQQHGFASNELWEVRKIPIQTAGTTLTPMTNQLHGTEVRITGLRPRYWDESAYGGKRVIELKVTAVPPRDNRRWHLTIAKAIDSTGLDVTSNGWSGGDERREFSFQVATNATSIDVWIAYAPSRFMEFTAQPTLNTGPVKAQR
jgi:hypothetical protein